MPLALTKVSTPYPWWKLQFDGSAWVDYVRPNGNVELWAVTYYSSGWSEWLLSCTFNKIVIYIYIYLIFYSFTYIVWVPSKLVVDVNTGFVYPL